jgi:HSP20 family molecular chaperone IbpA
MAIDTGTAKAKYAPRDNSSVQPDSSPGKDKNIPNQVDPSIPIQTNSSSNAATREPSSIPVQRENSSSRNISATLVRSSPSASAEHGSIAARNSSPGDNSVSVPVNPENDRSHSKLNSKVATRAYELFQQNGGRHGDDLFHWLQAESEILTRIPEIRQTGSSFSVVAAVEGFNPEDISVTVEATRALILADKQDSSNGGDSRESQLSRKFAFFITDWPDEVEPSAATAQIKEGNLVLTVKRANGVKLS